MKALIFERSLPRYAAARVAGALTPGGGSRVGPLRLVETDEPDLPGPDWQRVRPLLSGICGSDLSTVDGHASRYFEDIVSFPFTPGHEVVGVLDDGARVIIEPVLGCVARGIEPPCPSCAQGRTGGCERIAFGHLAPGLQTGYCTDTGGGWSGALVAHASQLHRVPDSMSDEAAVMVEPTACGVHAALAAGEVSGATVAILGAGTLGLCTLAAVRLLALPGNIVIGAKYPEQRALARDLGATVVAEPGELRRALRRVTRSMEIGDRLTGGADVVIDCVGSADSLAEALAVVRPRGRVVMVGMPGRVSVDLTPLWHREISLVGAYAYGKEHVPAAPGAAAASAEGGATTAAGADPMAATSGAGGQRTFALAMDLVGEADLGRLVSARYPLDRFTDAIEHAATAGRRGAVKVVFDLHRPGRRGSST